jgi:hypothetical protein
MDFGGIIFWTGEMSWVGRNGGGFGWLLRCEKIYLDLFHVK